MMGSSKVTTSRSEQPEEENGGERILSPFAQTTTFVSPKGSNVGSSWMLWLVTGTLATVIAGNIAYFAMRYLDNPYRTLEPFPIERYMADFQPLAGSKFGAEWKVVADLGWKENVGRLMVFSAPGDDRPILVMIPPRLSGLYFSKGQMYRIAMEVGEGGLIHADSCDKD